MPLPARILLIGYAQLRRYGKTRVSWFNKLHRGLIQNGHLVHWFSDRDTAAFEAPFGLRDLGHGKANKRLVETAEAFEPDLIIIGHADIITNDTLLHLKKISKCSIVHCNNDPLFIQPNVEKITHRLKVCEHIFISTGKTTIDEFFPDEKQRTHHMPNPVDSAIERFDVSKLERDELDRDLIFCGNATKFTRREETLQRLKAGLPKTVRFDTFGLFGTPPLWGLDYDRALSKSAMGLNLNRDEGHHWYSSARMAQLGGNGLVVLTNSANSFQTLFPEGTLVYYDKEEELLEKVKALTDDDSLRRSHASATRTFFHTHLNNRIYAQHIVETALELPHSQNYIWTDK